MTQYEFLQRLSNSLSSLADSEKQEIIQDFQEHFSAGLDMGKTEQQICEELGEPEACAAQYLGGVVPPQTARPIAPTHRGPAGLNPNNNPNNTRNQTLWRVLFFFFAVCAFAVYPVAIGLMASPIIIIIAAVLMVAIVPTALMVLFMVSLCIALFSAGLLTFLVMSWLLKTSFARSGF